MRRASETCLKDCRCGSRPEPGCAGRGAARLILEDVCASTTGAHEVAMLRHGSTRPGLSMFASRADDRNQPQPRCARRLLEQRLAERVLGVSQCELRVESQQRSWLSLAAEFICNQVNARAAYDHIVRHERPGFDVAKLPNRKALGALVASADTDKRPAQWPTTWALPQ